MRLKKKSYLQASKTNFPRLHQMKAAEVKITPEHPELHVKRIARAIVRKGLSPVPPKASVSLRNDVDQTRINAALRAFKEATLASPLDVDGVKLGVSTDARQSEK